MGTSSLTMYLTPAEINEQCIKNASLVTRFNKCNNSDGNLRLEQMRDLTDRMVETSILQKIIQITSSSKVYVIYEEFKYLYALFHTENTEAKLNFILDFVFFNKKGMNKEVYMHRVKKYYSRHQLLMEVLTNERLFDGKLLDKPKVSVFIKNNSYNQFAKFRFIKEMSEINDESNSCNGNGSKKGNECSCWMNNNDKTSSNDTPIKFKEYDSLQKEFMEYEKHNKGIFPISLFEKMFHEINVKQSLINLICSYLKKKTQKSFINFDLFKHLYHILTSDQIEDSLFELLSYPKKDIKKNDLFLFIKSTKNAITSKEINDYFNEMDIKDTISREKFNSMISLINKELLDSFEHIKYLRYTHFKIKCPDKLTEKNCIEILMKKKTFNEALKDQAKYEDNFFIIDATFWRKWSEHVSTSLKTSKKAIRINTDKISDKHGRIREGLVYIKDYLIIGQRMYNLFIEWYGSAYENDMKRSKIFFPENDNMQKRRIIYREDSPFCGIDFNNRKYEIEVSPVFLLFFNFEELSSKYDSINDIKINLAKSGIDNCDTSSYTPFSRRSRYYDFIKPLEESTNLKLDMNTTRFWVFHQNKFYMNTDMNRIIEEDNIITSGIIILETSQKSAWPSDKYQQILSTPNVHDSTDRLAKQVVGLVNIGNTCYMNAVLQTFLNNNELKDVMLNTKQIEYMLSRKRDGQLMKEMISLFKEKYQSDIRFITPKKFKEICGEYNDTFSDYEEQDAYDFYTFLVDSLHEDINIKGTQTKIEKVDKITDAVDKKEQGNVQWANNLRNNLSYLHSIFLGQLKSELKCNKCHFSKVSYETFSSLSLPIPEDMMITLDVYLFRLPFTMKVYYEDINAYVKQNKQKGESMRSFLKNIRKKQLGLYVKEKTSLTLNTISNCNSNNNSICNNSNNITEVKRRNVPLTTAYYEQETKIKKDNDSNFINAMNLNIPYKLRIEVNRKEKCSEIIRILKSISDLELEQDFHSKDCTTFIITNMDKYADSSLSIDECFNHGQEAYVYELLTSQGMQKLYDYPKSLYSNSNFSPDKLHHDLIPSMIQNNTIIPTQTTNQEVIIMISHRNMQSQQLLSKDKCFFPNKYDDIESFKDYIILSLKDSMKPKHLYNFMWEKYEYFLNNPTKYEGSLWWKKRMAYSINSSRMNSKTNLHFNQANGLNNINNNNINALPRKNCMPFILKLVHKTTKACLLCPWFQFCSGCILDPSTSHLLQIDINTLIIVEWCYNIAIKEIYIYKNYKLTINDPSIESLQVIPLPTTTHGSFSMKNDNQQESITLNDCLKLFTESEEVNDVYCEVCACKSSFKKKYEIERLPKYLVITLKRFKYTALYKKKITSLINFPEKNLNLSNFLCPNSINAPRSKESNIDLFAIINHCGSLTEGHYSSIINHDDDNGRWIKYDDSRVTEYKDSLQTPSVYMLIYKVHSNIRVNALSENQDRLYFNYDGLLFTAYKLYIQRQMPEHVFNFDYSKDDSDNCKVKHIHREALYYYGEPVNTSKGKGYLVNVYESNGKKYAKVKKDIGYIEVSLEEGEGNGYSIKESIVIENIKISERMKRSEENEKVPAKTSDCGCLIY